MVETFQMKMPAFQKKLFSLIYCFAVSRSGFSRNASTTNTSLLRAELAERSACIYPYPVSGRVGFMPSVMMASLSPVVFSADFMTRLNSVTSVTIWSLGVTTMFAFGFIFFILQLT